MFPHEYKTKGMCENAFKRELWTLHFVSDEYKTKEMCKEAVKKEPYVLNYDLNLV